jgi:hypothetical protein
MGFCPIRTTDTGKVRLSIFRSTKYAKPFLPTFLRLPFGRNRPIMKRETSATILRKRQIMNPLTRVESMPKNTEVISRKIKFIAAVLSL